MRDFSKKVSPERRNFKRQIFIILAKIFWTFPFRKILGVGAEKLFLSHESDGKTGFPFIRLRKNPCFQILTYHRVNDENDWVFRGTPSTIFKQQMEYLRENWKVFSLNEMVERIQYRDIPEKAVVVTFDDGYADNYTNAFPILCEMGIPATFFLVTQAINTGMIIWHDRIFNAFRKTQRELLEGFGVPKQNYSFKDQEEKLSALHSILKFIRSLDPDSREKWISQLYEQLDVLPMPSTSNLMMNWDQVRQMKEKGGELGSHTNTHPILSKMSLIEMERELVESRNILIDELSLSSFVFAYPNGTSDDFNEDTIDLLKNNGYLCAVTTIPGNNGCDSDLFRLKRSTPWDVDIEQFALRLHAFKFCRK